MHGTNFDGKKYRPGLADIMDVQTVVSGEYTFQCFASVGTRLEEAKWAIKRIRTFENVDNGNTITVIRERWRKRKGDTGPWPSSFFCFRADDWNLQNDDEYTGVDPSN